MTPNKEYPSPPNCCASPSYFYACLTRGGTAVNAASVLLTSSTLMAVVTPPAFWKAQGKLSSPAPSADLSMMNTAPNEPSLGGSEWDADRANRLMLSRASSSMTPNRLRETRCYTEEKLGLVPFSSTVCELVCWCLATPSPSLQDQTVRV